jgi:hypothetical protein
MSGFLRSGVLRPFSGFVQRIKVSIGASIFLAGLAGVMCSAAYSGISYAIIISSVEERHE